LLQQELAPREIVAYFAFDQSEGEYFEYYVLGSQQSKSVEGFKTFQIDL